MATVINLNNDTVFKNKTLILDTNVWLYLFSPYTSNDHGYSDIWEKILEQECDILVPPIIFSEYINRLCRQAFEYYCDSNNKRVSYKHCFRKTENYKFTYINALNSVNEDILGSGCVRMIDIEESIISTSLTSTLMADFNDDIILKTAIKYNANIVTHDKDYQDINKRINIYTIK